MSTCEIAVNLSSWSVRVAVALAWLVGTTTTVRAQPTVELQTGLGYVFGRSNPSLGTLNVGAEGSVSQVWGVALRYVRSITDERAESRVVDGGVRILLKRGELSYLTLTARRRWTLSPDSTITAGFGAMFAGRVSAFYEFLPNPSVPLKGTRTFNGVGLEFLVSRRISGPLGLKVGATWDLTLDDVSCFQPLALGTISF